MGGPPKPRPASPANMSKRGLFARHYAPNQTLIMVNRRLPKGNLAGGMPRMRHGGRPVPRHWAARWHFIIEVLDTGSSAGACHRAAHPELGAQRTTMRRRQLASEYGVAFPRRDSVRVLCRHPRNKGAGNAGCALHPRSRVQKCTKESAHEHTGSAEAIRHSLRNGLTAYAELSPENRALLSPSPHGSWHVGPVGPSAPPQDLTPTAEASGPHGFAVRFSAVVLRAVYRSRVLLALRSPCTPTLPRPPHPIPRS